jgi:hypothetical protein
MIRNQERVCINLTDEELNKSIYRIFSIERLLEIFDKKEITLVRPHKWDDPFENYIFNKLSKTQKTGNKNKLFEFFKNSLYGQCWTFLEESEAMWRIYAPNKNGVKVKTTIYNLIETMQLQMYAIAEMCPYIAKVKYQSVEELEKFYNELVNNFTGHSEKDILNLVNSITIKRFEYKYEEEVRLIYFEPFETLKTDTIRFKIDPEFQFDEIILDPRMNDDLCNIYIKIINEYFGYPPTLKFEKSTLYALPKFNT